MYYITIDNIFFSFHINFLFYFIIIIIITKIKK